MDDAGAAAERADEIMEYLASLDAEGPGFETALRAGGLDLAILAARFPNEHWLTSVLSGLRGAVQLELWRHYEVRGDLNAACELLLSAVEGTPEPDEAAVSDLLLAVGERYQQSQSPRDRDAFIKWGMWQLDRLAADPEIPRDDAYLVSLREEVAFLLNDRADARDGDLLADLTAAIAHYEALLPVRPVGQPARAELLAFIVHAYFDLIGAVGGTDELVDRMAGHARKAWAAPGLADDARGVVGFCLGLSLLEQFSRPGPLPDMALVDLGIGALSEVMAELDDPDLETTAETALGVLLVGKGQLAGDAASMAEAEPHLLRAAQGMQVNDPKWSLAVRCLAGAEAALAVAGFPGHADRAVSLLHAAAEYTTDPEQAAMIGQSLGAVLFMQQAGRRGPATDEAISQLTAAFQRAPAKSPIRAHVAFNLGSVLAGRYFASGSLQDLQAARHYLQILDGGSTEGLPSPPWQGMPDARLMVAALRGQIEIARGAVEGDQAARRAGVVSLRTAVRLAGPGHLLLGRLRSDLGVALLTCFTHDRDDTAVLGEAITELEASVKLVPPGHPMRDITLFRMAAAVILLGESREDVGTLRDGAARMRDVRAGWTSQAGDPLRVTAMLAIAHAELHRLTRDAADLAAARAWYATAAAEFMRQPGHPRHGYVLIGQARLEHRVGAASAAIQAGLAALRVRARDVLLQSGAAHGLATARIAAAEAAEVAGWCLAADAEVLAVEALELGRGLVLHAATSSADLPELLHSAGREDLADEWRLLSERRADEPWNTEAVSGTLTSLLADEWLAVPSDLRERTLTALDDDALVTPPRPVEIGAALRRIGSDVLAYLLPPRDGRTGQALLVTADGGEPRTVPLTELTAPGCGWLDEFAVAQDRLLAEHGSLQARIQWADKLGTLCDSAWTTVIEPLLEKVPRVSSNAPPRLVLVPVGTLGMVPWHAARRPAEGTPWRYAVADAVFSYAASARQLAEVSRRSALPIGGSPVIVAPRDESLPGGRAEASAVRDLYPDARYLGYAEGKAADGPAAPGNVLDALPAPGEPGASMLHLVCHATATSAGADASYLLLENGTSLTVREILRHSAGRPAGSPGGTVILGACRTDVTATDHDEALTLSTAFLAAGAVTAVGSRWDLRDAPSAALMFMFHHFLAAGLRPADSLREAQLWMLDPDREPPPSMPDALRNQGRLDDVVAWAGFTHQGR